MKTIFMEGSCLTQCKETFACSSLGVPESAWNFFIGGYQPAQKWLKDRKGMILSFEDVKHYQHIIYVLQQTERIMNEIDNL